jgi:hypothetical protein
MSDAGCRIQDLGCLWGMPLKELANMKYNKRATCILNPASCIMRATSSLLHSRSCILKPASCIMRATFGFPDSKACILAAKFGFLRSKSGVLR